MREGERFALVVGDVHRREVEVALQPLELRAHAIAQLSIEIGERLIEQQDLRLHYQGACQREPLLLAAGELRGVALEEIVEGHRLQHPHDPLADFGLGEPAHLERKRGVLKDVHVRPDGVGLKHHAEIALVGRNENGPARRIDRAPADLNLARSGLFQARDRAQRRGLAAARGAKQREQLALRHLERDVLHRLDRAAALVGVFGEQRSDAEQAHPRVLQVSAIPNRRPTSCANMTSTNSATISMTPSAESSTYCPFCHSSQIMIDTTSVPGE